MSYDEQWAALATRIKGLQSAGDLYARFQSYHQEDSYGAGQLLNEQCAAVVRSLQLFRDNFAGVLPPEAVTRLNHFLGTRAAAAAGSAEAAQRGARAALVGLVGFEAEISFILAGRQGRIRARSERALLHLQQCLAVDEDFAVKWKKAHDKDEPACERLGAIHLLWHGIFAFKVDAKGGRTDLVFNEPPESSILTGGIEGLVLTEWKVADERAAATKKIQEARKQADLYSQGAVAGVELRGYRYLIVVSLKQLSMPPDETAGGVVYRHVNIAVQPDVPSIAAPKLVRQERGPQQRRRP
jgi:hypothetical protein